jgi:hypothetical protein
MGKYDVDLTVEKSTYVDDSGAVLGESFEVGDTLYAKLQRVAGKFNIEQRGIERVPESERTDTHGLVNVGTMVNCSPISTDDPYIFTDEIMNLSNWAKLSG